MLVPVIRAKDVLPYRVKVMDNGLKFQSNGFRLSEKYFNTILGESDF